MKKNRWMSIVIILALIIAIPIYISSLRKTNRENACYRESLEITLSYLEAKQVIVDVLTNSSITAQPLRHFLSSDEYNTSFSQMESMLEALKQLEKNIISGTVK